MTKLKDLSGVHTERVRLPTALATAGTEDIVALFVAPFNLTVEAVRLVPQAAITGETDTQLTLTIMNRGAAGDGTTAIATLVFDDDLDAVAFVDQEFTLSATAANLNVDEGHVIAIDKTVVSTGLGVEGVIEIDYINRGS